MIAAIVAGHMALNRVKKYPPQHAGRGFAITGLVIGYLSQVLWVGAITLFIVAAFHGF
jgi:hypothetical protein